MSFGIPTRNGLSLGLGAVPTLATNFGLPIPSLSLDYTIPSDGTPGVVPGFYQVDNGFGVLTQTTFSSLITFSRASNATRFSPTGQLQYAPHNLLLQSQTFDNASWLKSGSTIAANTTIAPDGTTTADTSTANASTAVHDVVAQTVVTVSGLQYTASIFAKAGTLNYIQISVNADATTYANFDLSTGTVGTTGGTITTSITAVANGFYRCSMTYTSSGTNRSPIFVMVDSSSAARRPSWTALGTETVIAWGAQFAVGPNALDYTPTTTAVVYGPRFDYDPTTLAAKGLLIEEQRTNSVLYSEQFDNAAWAKSGSTVTANTIIAPDGTVAGDSLVEDSGSSGHRIAQTYVGNSTVLYTASFYAKLSGRSWARVLIDDNSGNSADAYFNLAAGVIGTTAASGTATAVSSQIQAVGNGWYRCTVTCVPSAINSGNVRAYISGTTGNGTSSYTGTNGLTSIFIWGAQLEAGAFATSYIPTTTAATTRSADIASIGTLSPWYNSVEMTVYTEYDIIGKTTTSGFATEIDDGTLNNRIINIGQEIGVGDVKLGSFMNSGGSTSVNDYPITAMNVGSVYKLAFAVKSNDAATVANGISVLDATAVIPSGLTTLRLGRRITDRYLNGHLRRITYTPRRLTDAELQSLTS